METRTRRQQHGRLLGNTTKEMGWDRPRSPEVISGARLKDLETFLKGKQAGQKKGSHVNAHQSYRAKH